MRRFLIILEGATIGIVVAYGVLGLWRDWKMSQWPEAVVEQFEIHPVSPSEGLGIGSTLDCDRASLVPAIH